MLNEHIVKTQAIEVIISDMLMSGDLTRERATNHIVLLNRCDNRMLEYLMISAKMGVKHRLVRDYCFGDRLS